MSQRFDLICSRFLQMDLCCGQEQRRTFANVASIKFVSIDSIELMGSFVCWAVLTVPNGRFNEEKLFNLATKMVSPY